MPTALVTGASRGIGAAITRRLADEGWSVIALGRDGDALAHLPVAQWVVADLADPASLAAALPALDTLDALVHCAGLGTIGPLQESDSSIWQRILSVNVAAVAELTRLLLPPLRAANGAVITVNSGQGRSASGGWSAYAASKFGLRGFTDALREEEPRIRVTSIYPGRTATDMQREVRAAEGGPYEPERYIDPSTIATIVWQVLTTSPDAVITEVVVRPSR